MPAQSQQQQKLFGLALAFKRGEVPSSEVSDEIKAIADRMSEKEIEDFASTTHKGLPKKMKEQLRNIVREIMREQAISEMNEVSINEDENPCWDGYEMVGMKMKDGKEVPNCVPKNESVNEEVINEIGVLGVAGGVALGLVGFIALSKGVGFAKRKFGNAMANVADKMEKKVKKIESDNAKKAIMDIAKKFENDKKLQSMYQSLPAYKDGGKNSERKKGMAEIAKYVKSKLSSDEMQYFYDLNTYLRTNKIKGTLVAPEKKSAFQKRLDKLGADNAHLSNESVNEQSINELNPRLNKKVKSYLDAYLKGEKKNSPEHQHAIMLIMKGALTDANFHSEAKKLDKLFPKAKQSKYVGTKMEDVIEDKGTDIAGWAKWDGHDIIDAFAFYTNMNIGGGFGNKLTSLKESINEGKKSKDSTGIRKVVAIYNNVDAIIDSVFEDKKDVKEVVGVMGPVLVNAINATLKHKFKPTDGNEDKLNEFKSKLKELLKLVDALIKKPSKAGTKRLETMHRNWWNHSFGADIVFNGKYADSIIESVNEGASTEEKKIVMMAIKKIAKYRNVPLNVALIDTIRAAEELERTIKK